MQDALSAIATMCEHEVYERGTVQLASKEDVDLFIGLAEHAEKALDCWKEL
jgi:hypothetical protein